MHSHRMRRGLLALALTAGVTFFTTGAKVSGQDEPGKRAPAPVQPLARGPIHEAFAQPTVFDPKPGLIVPNEPPKPVEEIPADQKPEGENVAWIGGYWSWDEEAKNFIWVSGIWRNLPPGRQWMPGYWRKLDNGHQWVSGFWAGADKKDVQYLPNPPPSLERGPSSEAPGADYIWSPGCWQWHDSRYIWQAGCWIDANPGWIWTPPSYSWTPSGCLYNDGYWDYSLRRRGLLFAPVVFNEPLYLDAGYSYYPRTCVDLDLVTDHFFAWPSYRHYCFGNYYSNFHVGFGISPWFSFSIGRHHGWCDPIFSYYSWHHGKHDPHWHNGLHRKHEHFRHNEHARPGIHHKGDGHLAGGAGLIKPVEHIAAKRDLPIRLEKVGAEGRREQLLKSNELQQLRTQRGKAEAQASRPQPRSVEGNRPLKLDLPNSPVVAKPGKDLSKPPVVTRPPAAGARTGAEGRIDMLRTNPGSPALNSRPRTEVNRPSSPVIQSPTNRPSVTSDLQRNTPPRSSASPRVEIGPRTDSRPEMNVRPPANIQSPTSRPGVTSDLQRNVPPRSTAAPRVESGPRTGSRPEMNVRPPSASSPRIESRPPIQSGPRMGSAPQTSSPSRMESAPRMSAPRSSSPSSMQSAPRASPPPRASAPSRAQSAPRASSPSRSSGSPARSSGGNSRGKK